MKTFNFLPLCLITTAVLFFGLFVSAQEQPSANKVAEWKKGAEKGDSSAQYWLGTCYDSENRWRGTSLDDGQGVAKDDVEAVKWYRKAAEQGNALAQAVLGGCYSTGRGVEKDDIKAVKWYRKAAEQGLPDSQFDLGGCYFMGQGVTKDEVEAVKWLRKAAEQGNVLAQAILGGCYFTGRGVAKNEVEGYKWVLLAAAQGEETAKKNIPAFESMLSPAQRAEGQRLAQEWQTKERDRLEAFARVAQECEAKRVNHESSQSLERRPATEATKAPHNVTGTGFLITHNGYLITNHHVVKDSGKVRVQTTAGLLDAVVVRTDAASDLALLKVTGTFDALPVVSSSNSRLGSTVATVGFPNIGLQGFEPKLSKGDISSLAGMQDDVKQFQISVPVQPGNSGGALVDERGNVVGVVTAQLNQEAALTSSGTLAQNVNYAVKSSYLLGFLEAVPDVGAGLVPPKTNEQKFESVVDDVKKATVLIVAY